MRRTPPTPRTSGYSLIELALVLTLLAIFAAMANKLFIQCVVIKRDALRAGDSIVHTENVVRLLRSDVWNATALSTDRPDQLALEMPDGSLVDWRLNVFTTEDETESQAYLVRSESQHGETVSDSSFFALADTAFRADGPNLYLSAGDETIRLTVMSGLIQGGRP